MPSNRLWGRHHAQHLTARRWMARSASDSAILRRAARSSARSGVVRPDSRPRSVRSCRSQEEIVWSLISRWKATSGTVRPEATRSGTLRRTPAGTHVVPQPRLEGADGTNDQQSDSTKRGADQEPADPWAVPFDGRLGEGAPVPGAGAADRGRGAGASGLTRRSGQPAEASAATAWTFPGRSGAPAPPSAPVMMAWATSPGTGRAKR